MNSSALSNQNSQTRLLGAITIVGAVLMVLQFSWLGWVEGLPNLANSTVPRSLLLAIASLCLMAGPIGLRSVRAWSGRLGTVGMGLTLIGMALWVVASFYFIANPDQEFNQLLSPAGGFAQCIGMILIGISTLRSKVLRGWQAFVPLLTGLFFVAQLPVQIAFRLSQGLPPLYYLQAVWSLFWISVGYVILTVQARSGTYADNKRAVSNSL